MNSMYIWHYDRYRSRVLLSTHPTLDCDLEVKVTDLEFSYKSQNVCINLVYIAVSSRPFDEFHLIWHDGRYRFKVLLREIQGKTLRSRS